jgi:hypothetical protein
MEKASSPSPQENDGVTGGRRSREVSYADDVGSQHRRAEFQSQRHAQATLSEEVARDWL